MNRALLNDQGHTEHQQLNNILIWALTTGRIQNQSNCSSTQRNLQALSRDQADIGWNQIIKGRWSTKWVQRYDAIYPEKGEKYSAKQITLI
jgi:hypothetical protein